MKKNIIMKYQADKSWIHDGDELTREEIKDLNEVEYGFMKNLLKVVSLAILAMAVSRHFHF